MLLQSFDRNEFEIIIGCLEYSSALLDLVKTKFRDLRIVLVMSGEEWNVSLARNIAMKEARGELIVFVDADILAPRDFLLNHYSAHARLERPALVIGQMRDYDEGLDMTEKSLPSFEFYKENFLLKSASEVPLPKDIRWTLDKHIDWALGWTANLSLLRKEVQEHNLFFDEDFKGWGVEDIEWAYRIALSGIDMHFGDEIWAIHLPHFRNVGQNHLDESINFKKMLCKWPRMDVEIVTSIGDVKGNQKYAHLDQAMKTVTDAQYGDFGMLELRNGEGAITLYAGVAYNREKNEIRPGILTGLDGTASQRMLPLIGLSTPYGDKEVECVRLSPAIAAFDEEIREKIRREFARISVCVVPGD
jgi:glycosyltransferase involved in cell wall biosynthesis